MISYFTGVNYENGVIYNFISPLVDKKKGFFDIIDDIFLSKKEEDGVLIVDMYNDIPFELHNGFHIVDAIDESTMEYDLNSYIKLFEPKVVIIRLNKEDYAKNIMHIRRITEDMYEDELFTHIVV